jgi:glycosyltransferase involved in cell wall biosynthesis
MKSRIPCTACILTRNAERTIVACLDALGGIDEVIVQDASTDRTQELAAHYPNVRLIPQNPAYLDSEGRCTHFACMRNEGVRAASHDWILVVDSDEILTLSFLEEVAAVIAKGEPAICSVFRRFFLHGQPVMHFACYPAFQVRLFHRRVVEGYGKAVHERVIPLPGTRTQMLRTEFPEVVPALSVQEMKYAYYRKLEAGRLGRIPLWRWMRWILLRNLLSALAIVLRMLWIHALPRRGMCMPIAYELQYIRHQLRIIVCTFPYRRHSYTSP